MQKNARKKSLFIGSNHFRASSFNKRGGSKMHPRVIIVGTVPYNVKSTSRAFDAYFHYWERENLAQIFSNPKKPCKGHCGTLYQITDYRILQRWLGKKEDPGIIFKYEDLDIEWKDNSLEVNDQRGKKAYKFGQKHTPLTHLLRGILWRKKYWRTKKLDEWLDEFCPECVFLAFSDDYFISKIALYIARKYNIPIVSCIGDDYYFNVEKTFNPLYYIYKFSYRQLINKVLAWKGSAIYISNKIRDKYNSEFNLDGQTVYLSSTIKRKDFRIINKENPIITYFGNIRMGRNNSLNEIGYALGEINPNYILEVYSNEQNEDYFNLFHENRNVSFLGSISYSEVIKRMGESDITIIVEGFKEEDINLSRYSLSTKAADTLASGTNILVYGSLDCGIVEYMKSTSAATVCTNKRELKNSIINLIENVDIQKSQYEQAVNVSDINHSLQKSTRVSEDVILNAMNKGREKYE